MGSGLAEKRSQRVFKLMEEVAFARLGLKFIHYRPVVLPYGRGHHDSTLRFFRFGHWLSC
jgi:hypothetical protein